MAKYWTEQQDIAVNLYNKSTDSEEREKIYHEFIEKPLNKLIECMYNRFKWPYINESVENIKADIAAYVMTKLHMFKSEKGDSFGYFNMMVRNTLVLWNNQGYSKFKKEFPLEINVDEETINETENAFLSTYYEFNSVDLEEFIKLLAEYLEDNKTKIFQIGQLDFADGIIKLLKEYKQYSPKRPTENLIFYLDILTMSDSTILQVQDMTKNDLYFRHAYQRSLKRIAPIYKSLLKKYIETGTFEGVHIKPLENRGRHKPRPHSLIDRSQDSNSSIS